MVTVQSKVVVNIGMREIELTLAEAKELQAVLNDLLRPQGRGFEAEDTFRKLRGSLPAPWEPLHPLVPPVRPAPWVYPTVPPHPGWPVISKSSLETA